MIDINKEIDEMAEKLVKSEIETKTTQPTNTLQETILSLGATELKKAMLSMTDSQKETLSRVLEDMSKGRGKDKQRMNFKKSELFKSMITRMVERTLNKETCIQGLSTKFELEKSVIEPIWEEIEKSGGEGSKGGKVTGHTSSGNPIYDKAKKFVTHLESHPDYQSEKHPMHNLSYSQHPDHEKHWDEAKKQAKEIGHDANTVINMKKSETNEQELSNMDMLRKSIERMIERKLEKSECVEKLAKSIGCETEVLSDIWDKIKVEASDFALEKAINPFETRKIGQNCCYNVDSAMESVMKSVEKGSFDYAEETLEKSVLPETKKAEESQVAVPEEMKKKKGKANSDKPLSGDPKELADEGEKPPVVQKALDINDLIEKSLDYTDEQIQEFLEMQNVKPTGAFLVKSFEEKDLEIEVPEKE
ncbi:MAG: hypothetical protein DRN81_02275 [Thermoproteota archaeon]|nr:MAG: hypothetical protein DRN81_02275 [Candidatus Korarchaeota archaeon]